MKHEQFASDLLKCASRGSGGAEISNEPSPRRELRAVEPQAGLLKSKRPRQLREGGLNALSIRRNETRKSDTRRQSREPLQSVSAQVLYGSRTIEVELLNLSGGGAMIACDLQPNLSDQLTLRLHQRDAIECLVRWLKGGRIGLEFAHETQLQCSDEEQVSLLRDVVRRADPDELIEVSGGTGKADIRSSFRHPLIWSGELVYRQQRRKVRLRNVSAGGALVEGPVSPRVGSDVLLDLGRAGLLTATVRWATGDCAGLEFDHPFDLASLARSKPRLVPATWLRPAYLEKVVPETSGWDQGWNRLSLGDVREQLEGFLKY